MKIKPSVLHYEYVFNLLNYNSSVIKDTIETISWCLRTIYKSIAQALRVFHYTNGRNEICNAETIWIQAIIVFGSFSTENIKLFLKNSSSLVSKQKQTYSKLKIPF